MKTPAIIRILVIAALALFLIEMVSRTSDTWAVIENPTLLLVWIGIVLFMVATFFTATPSAKMPTL